MIEKKDEIIQYQTICPRMESDEITVEDFQKPILSIIITLESAVITHLIVRQMFSFYLSYVQFFNI